MGFFLYRGKISEIPQVAHFMIISNILGYDEPNVLIIAQVKEGLSNEYQNLGELQIEYSGQLLP